MRISILTRNSRETHALAFKLAKQLKKSKQDSGVLALYGDLACGKTVFSKGFCAGLGLKEADKKVTSSTFVLTNEYHCDFSDIYHCDWYRMEKLSPDQKEQLRDIMDQKAFVLVEWADKVKGVLPKKRWDIYFEHVKPNQRKITFDFDAKSNNFLYTHLKSQI